MVSFRSNGDHHNPDSNLAWLLILTNSKDSSLLTRSHQCQGIFSPFLYFPTLPWSLLNSTLVNEEVFHTASFGGDVKPSVPGDLTRLAFGYFRPSLATSGKVDHGKLTVSKSNSSMKVYLLTHFNFYFAFRF